MKASLILTITSVFVTIHSFSQTVVWSEDFNSGSGAQGNPVTSYTSGNGTWTQTDVGSIGGFPNTWYVSDQESGAGVNNCGAANLGNFTLHVGNVASSPGGLCPTGDCGAAYDASTGCETSERAESPVIDLTGQTGLTLEFEHIGFGEPGNDFANVVYSTDGGATWNVLPGGAGITSQCCCLLPGFCGGPDPIPCTNPLSGQGYWQLVTIPLPVACENNPNVKIGFHWINDGNNAGTDPSCAIDNVVITSSTASPPVADFSANLTTICEGDCIDFTDLSTISTNPTWSWTFTGAATTSSSVQNPTNICYNTAGTYQVELTVTDDNGTDTETKVAYITVNAPPNAGTSTSSDLCNNTTLDLNTVLTGQDAGGTWVETSGTPSGQFNAGTGVLDGNGLPVGNSYTFDYTVTGTAPCPDATATVTITIIDCTGGTPPTADFSTSNTVICEGDCIDFTDASTVGTNPTWSWTFTGAGTTSSTSQNPTGICYPTAGTYTVELTVTDDNGTDTETKVDYITVNPRPTVTATAAPNDTVCTGDQVTLTGGGATSYTWDNGVTDNTPFTPTATTTYTVTGTDGNGCSSTAFVTVVVESCDSLIANWSVSDTTICLGECVTFTDESTGPVSSWEWDFGSGGTPNTSTMPNPTVCFDTTGIFTVSLQVIGGGDTSTLTQNITVFDGPTVTAGLDTLIDLGGAADLWATGSGPGSWQWIPGTDVACDTCAVTTASPYLNTQYIVILTDINGCMGSDTVDVMVNFIEGIDVPTAFSPNGDGRNDVLYVKGIGIETMTFSVYNRYGERVFQGDNQNIGWDGTYKGRDENSGVFTWMLEYKLVNGSVGVLKGNTTLIR